MSLFFPRWLALAVFCLCASQVFAQNLIRVPGHIPPQVAQATHLGRLPAETTLQLLFPLKPNVSAVADLIAGLSRPGDPRYKQYVTPEQFAESYGPTPSDVDAVVAFAKAQGLRLVEVHPNRSYVLVEGTSADIERAFSVEMHQYQTLSGKVAFAPNVEPLLPAEVSARIHGIVGLSSFSQLHHHASVRTGVGSGVGGGLIPSDIRTIYDLNGITATGAGQSIALLELDGFVQSDITAYDTEFKLAGTLTPQVIQVDGASSKPTKGANSGQPEVTLDIQMAQAMAPAVQVLVYEGPNTAAGVIATYTKIATDNTAKSISSSWGEAEDGMTAAEFAAENSIFMQYAAQGQSFFAAAGDSGAYDDPANPKQLMVDDPGSQPYTTGVGGTTLSVSAGEVYKSESAWGDAKTASGGGGGISSQWTIPSWQVGLGTTSNLGSSSMRMVPDVALNADLNTGYVIIVNGVSGVVGGTSCGAPLWAAFTALVNEQNLATGLPVLGYMNPTLYRVGASSLSTTVFHDIADKSTNLFYPAVAGYDLATGLGTMVGQPLFNVLSGPVLPPAAPTNLQGKRVMP